MTDRRLALIGYPAEYFLSFARSLEASGFSIYWVCSLQADSYYLRMNGVLPERILDTAQSWITCDQAKTDWRQELAQFENPSCPRFNDIVLMDRLLVRKDWAFAQRYLHNLAISIDQFFGNHRITFVSSWRDTAMQLVAMLVARKRGIPFVVPTRIRLPQEMYGFCTAHSTDSFVPLHEPGDQERTWAEEFLRAFEAREMKPALKKASRSFGDVLRLMPSHARAFLYELRRSRLDAGNDYSRYPIMRLVAMYLKRRFNLLAYKVMRPADNELSEAIPFCLYALHTQPESSIDVQASYFSDQIELVRHIARSLPATHLLYVKVHPTDVDGKNLAFYRRLKSIPGVVLINFTVDSRMLLEKAAIVFALTGTIAYEAGLMQKPVVVFARNFFNALPTIHHCDAPPKLPGLIETLILAPRTDRRAEVLQFLTQLRCACFEGEVSRTYGASNEPLRPTDLRTAQSAYDAVYRAMTRGGSA